MWTHMSATKFVLESSLPAGLMGSGWLVQWWVIWKQTNFALWEDIATEVLKVKDIFKTNFCPTTIVGHWNNDNGKDVCHQVYIH